MHSCSLARSAFVAARYLLREKHAARDNSNVHVFTTEFYTMLTSKSYTSVRAWTRGVDIFTKDLIFVPVEQEYAALSAHRLHAYARA